MQKQNIFKEEILAVLLNKRPLTLVQVSPKGHDSPRRTEGHITAS
jgi:hypothetical protein